MDLFPLENTSIPKGKKGFLIFLDEFNSASLSVQAASYRIILDKRVGQHKLHPQAFIICAGNMMGDNAIVNRLGTAMQSRLIHLELSVETAPWLKWAATNHVDHRIMSYIESRPDNLHKFDPQHNDKTFSCPRTWYFASKLIKNSNESLRDNIAMLSGTIGEAVAHEFVSYTELYTHLPSFKDILTSPLTTNVDVEPAMLYAIAHMIAANTDKTNLVKLMQYITRLPIEFETITLQNIIRRDNSIVQEECVRNWIADKGMQLM